MTRKTLCLRSCVASITLAIICSTTSAQNAELDRRDWFGGDGNWSVDENWSDLVGPDAGPPDEDFWASLVSGTVTIDGAIKTGAVDVGRATLVIGQGRSLEVAPSDFTNGIVDTARGMLMLTGNGSFNGSDVVGNGTIHLEGPNAQFSISGDLDFGGEILVDVTPAGGGSLAVGGDVTLSGIVVPAVSGFSPSLGDSFDFITGADSIDVSQAQLALPSFVTLDRGLGAMLRTSGDTASIAIRNLPVLSIDRTTGESTISNAVGGPLELTGYSLFSQNGLLQTSSWRSLESQSIPGWATANPRDEAIGELNVTATSSLIAGATGVSIGAPYKAGDIHPSQEDVVFLASLADGSVVNGIVEYLGAPNDLTLRVDPATGDAEISQLSSFVDAVDITGYSVLSKNGSLTPASWSALNASDDDWVSANPRPTAIAEFSPSGSSNFASGTELALGKIYSPGARRDLVFQFATAVGEVLNGTVVYEELDLVTGGGCQPLNDLNGDFDGNGRVEFADFLVLSINFGSDVSHYEDGDFDCNGRVEFADFLALSTNFGATLGGEVAFVPEPSCTSIVCIGLLGLLSGRRRWIRLAIRNST